MNVLVLYRAPGGRNPCGAGLAGAGRSPCKSRSYSRMFPWFRVVVGTLTW